jgi:hypothetical protein
VETTLVNMTPHKIVVYGADSVVFDSGTRKFILVSEVETPLMIIPPSGVTATVEYTTVRQETTLNIEGDVLPLFKNNIKSITNLVSQNDTYHIVSFQYCVAAKEYETQLQQKPRHTLNLLTVKDTVYDTVGRIQGCLGFYLA